jgi:hypothetical protein
LWSCISAALTTDKTSPQPTGTQIGLSGSATCVGTPQYRFMIQPPGGAFSVAQNFGSSSNFTWNASGVGGTYTLELDAKGGVAAAASTMASTQLSFNLTQCTAVTLATSPSSPQIPGPTVTLTGSATCPGTPQYRFSINKPNVGWTIAQDFGAASTYGWNTTGLALGNYTLKVDVRNVGAATASEATAGAVYLLALPACSAATISVDLASPQGTGTVVTFSSTTTTCPHPVYQFWVLAPGSTWQIFQAYSPLSTFHWDTTGKAAGTYNVSVWTREATGQGASTTGLGSFDSFAAMTDALTSTPCTSMTSSVAPSSPSVAGTPVAITGSATCTHSNPLYEFLLLAPGGGWTVAQPYSTSATFNWDTAGSPAGTYHLSVWTRDASSSGTNRTGLGRYDAYAPGTAYTLTTMPCASVTASATPASPQAAGTPVTFTGSGLGCPNARYQFWILAPGGSWTIAQPYASSATFNWTTIGLSAGTYHYSVWVRDASSAAAYDAFAGNAYMLTLVPCTSVTASAAPASPQAHGTPITFTATAAGCPNPRYQFFILAPGGSWTIAQPYSSNATFNWSTSALPAGAYRYSVWARDASSAAGYDAYLPGTSYALN